MNAIAVLANNMNFVGYMLANMPKSLENICWFFVNETRIGNKIEELTKIVKASKIKQYEIIDSMKIVTECKKQIVNNDFVDSYTMGMNILMVWWIFKYKSKIDKILLVDDDVLFFDGVESFFEYEQHAFVQYRMSAGPRIFNEQSKNGKRTMHEWFKVFEIDNVNQDWWENVYLKKNLSSGNRMIVKKYFDMIRYEYFLKRFFMSKRLKACWDNRRVPTSGFLDERFETLFYLNESNNFLNNDSHILISKPEKVTDNGWEKLCSGRYKLIHIANKSWKQKTYDLLVKRGLINDRLT